MYIYSYLYIGIYVYIYIYIYICRERERERERFIPRTGLTTLSPAYVLVPTRGRLVFVTMSLYATRIYTPPPINVYSV